MMVTDLQHFLELPPDVPGPTLRLADQLGTIVRAATDDGLEDLIDAVAAEANHEVSRRRQQRLDAAFEVLSDAAYGEGGW